MVVLAGVAAAALALSLTAGAERALSQIIPTTTSSSPEETTSTTDDPTNTTETTDPTDTTEPSDTTTSSVEDTTTTVPPETTVSTARRTTTTRPGPTTTTFVPPSGVPSTTAAPTPEEVLDADLGKLPLFVGLSLVGFFVAVAIMGAQWVRTRR